MAKYKPMWYRLPVSDETTESGQVEAQMSMDLRLSQRVALQQHMTPQLGFLMHLLARPWQELRQELVAAVTDNPALEEVLEVEDDLAAPEEEVAAPELEAESPHSQSDEARLLEHLAGVPAQIW
jgi:DNA-directed RNA polymerase specialized sigma54-like protein